MGQLNILTVNATASSKCVDLIRKFCEMLVEIDFDQQVATINEARRLIHEASPFRSEPVDLVTWIPIDDITANDYNPNSVAPPEMRLLEHSISADGYTQPIVSWINDEEMYEVVDGFHRNRVGRESKEVRKRINGYLPLTVINPDRNERNDRIAATIRHNRARGKHQVSAMSDIVVELKRRNWSDEKIGKELGMDPDEVLRLTQITGLAEMFADREFSEAWESEQIEESDNLEIIQEAPDEDTLDGAASNGWDHRTDNRSVFNYEGAELARLNRAPSGSWNWTVYCAPMETGSRPTKEDAQCEADRIISSRFSQTIIPISTE